jgi:uncharacterized membrane-anchored protein YhcB (DUF1043 family)
MPNLMIEVGVVALIAFIVGIVIGIKIAHDYHKGKEK